MTLRVLGAVSEPGDPGAPNEDSCGASGDFAWVIDGATGLGDAPLLDGESDAAWLTAKIDGALREGAPDAIDARALLADVAGSVAARYTDALLRPPRERYEIPTAAVLLAHFRPPRIEIVELGDCAIYLLADAAGDNDGAPMLSRIGGTLSGRRAEKASARRLMGRGEGRSDAVRRVLRAARNRANAPDGYAIFAPDPRCTQRARHVSLTLPSGSAVLVTDGFEAALEDYELYDADGFFAETLASPEDVLRALRQVEAADPDCVTYPRFKRSDDATALAVTFSED